MREGYASQKTGFNFLKGKKFNKGVQFKNIQYLWNETKKYVREGQVLGSSPSTLESSSDEMNVHLITQQVVYTLETCALSHFEDECTLFLLH